jgi:hypothetical protein
MGAGARRALLLATAVLGITTGIFAQSVANLRGQVTDPSGAAIPGASVALGGPSESSTSAQSGISVQTGLRGVYQLRNLPPGIYSIRITAAGFAPYNRTAMELAAGSVVTIDVRLPLASALQEITVADTIHVELEPSKNASATLLQGQDLDMLSDDPDDLQNDLLALAGPAAGPDGGQIYVDGFSNGQLPPRGSILEVRMNSNPFSAEFDKIGYGRVDILTKPGTEAWHGSDFVQFDSAVFDARNPFAAVKPSFLSRQYEGNVGGSPTRKLSVFLDYTYRRQDDQALVNATILNSALLPITLLQNVPTPNTRTGISPRFDYQVTPNLTLQSRFGYTRYANDNTGVGQFNLPVIGTNTRNSNYGAQLTATWVINSSTANETRFQYVRSNNSTSAENSSPNISVAGAFTGGAANSGSTFMNQDSYEFQNYTTISHGTHLIRFGARLRGTLEATGTDQNFNGTFNFASIANYALTLSGLAQGLSWPQIVANGGGAYQYIVTTGTPLASAGLVDAAPFFQDDWRVRSNLTLSLGARYEIQNHISDKADITPRVGIAWGLGNVAGVQAPKTVLRAGFGTFFDRFALAQVVNAERLNGVNQQRYVIANPAFYLGDIPPLAQLAIGQPVTSYAIDSALVAPRLYQSTVTLERQLPKNITTSLSYVLSRGVHELRTRNINAPLPGTYIFGDPTSGVYPFGNPNPVDLYESSGLFKQQQIVWNVNARVNTKFSMFGYYMWARASSNTDGVNSFPANSYDEANEWSRSLYEVRDRFFIGGNIELPLAIRLAPAITYFSPMPYNITIGEDLNGDGQSNDRPSYATSADNPAYVVQTIYGALNLRPLPGETIIPRNLGTGYSSFTINLRASRTWGFGEPAASTAAAPASTMRRYNLTLSVEARNLLNNVNPGTPVGVLSSPLFGQPQGLSGVGGLNVTQSANRRLQLQLRFTF